MTDDPKARLTPTADGPQAALSALEYALAWTAAASGAGLVRSALTRPVTDR